MPQQDNMKCIRCKNIRTDFASGIKTCNRCKADKKRYQQTVMGKAVQKKADQKRQNDLSRILTRNEVSARMRLKYPEKIKARYLVAEALRKGLMERGACMICRKQNAQAHHPDYSKPLEVMWLCSLHHAWLHQHLRGGGHFALAY